MKDFFVFLKKELNTHPIDYAILLIGGAFFLLFLRLYQGQELANILIISLFVVFYMVWSVYHHGNTQTLHIKNVLEYVLIGIMILLLTVAIFAYK